jgi:hypothetical protein
MTNRLSRCGASKHGTQQIVRLRPGAEERQLLTNFSVPVMWWHVNAKGDDLTAEGGGFVQKLSWSGRIWVEGPAVKRGPRGCISFSHALHQL